MDLLLSRVEVLPWLQELVLNILPPCRKEKWDGPAAKFTANSPCLPSIKKTLFLLKKEYSKDRFK